MRFLDLWQNSDCLTLKIRLLLSVQISDFGKLTFILRLFSPFVLCAAPSSSRPLSSQKKRSDRDWQASDDLSAIQRAMQAENEAAAAKKVTSGSRSAPPQQIAKVLQTKTKCKIFSTKPKSCFTLSIYNHIESYMFPIRVDFVKCQHASNLFCLFTARA